MSDDDNRLVDPSHFPALYRALGQSDDALQELASLARAMALLAQQPDNLSDEELAALESRRRAARG